MNKQIKFINNSNYTKIIIRKNYINKYLDKLIKSNRKIYCFVDSKVKTIISGKQKFKNINFFIINCGENIKSINIYNQLCEKLLSKNIDRKSIIVSIGGGTLGDLSGFIAGTILRGIDFKLIPTTLLSQVDSSIGGKNGINSKNGKNLIGTFHHPSEVIIDVSVLKTLSSRELRSGYSEIVKHSLIRDLRFFNWLNKNYKDLLKLKTKTLEAAISRSIRIKLSYVIKDQFENLINKRSRAMLNFGHTFGHSLETFYKYDKKLNHGEAISIGMIIEAKISNKLGYLNKKDLDKIIDHFKKVKLKMYDKNISNKNIIKNIIKDKKNILNKINIVLLKNIGESFYKRDIGIEQINKIIKNI